jgi:hypothetical protein
MGKWVALRVDREFLVVLYPRHHVMKVSFGLPADIRSLYYFGSATDNVRRFDLFALVVYDYFEVAWDLRYPVQGFAVAR